MPPIAVRVAGAHSIESSVVPGVVASSPSVGEVQAHVKEIAARAITKIVDAFFIVVESFRGQK